MEAFVFYSLAAVTLVSALGVVTLRNTLHSALLLGLSLAGVAGLFGTLGADFLFGAQLLVYVGGIALLMLFVVMLAGRASELHLKQVNRMWGAGLAICGALFWGMWRYIEPTVTVGAQGEPAPTTARIGRLLLSDLAVPFELITVILIAALIGAVVFTRPEHE